MAIYMDLHIAPGVTAKDVAEAHSKDVMIQDEYNCKCITYWVDEERGSVFCLIDAPHKDLVTKMHEHSHGLIPHEIIEVSTNLVQAFLGRIQDPETFGDLANPDLKIFNDPAFRTIMVTEAMDTRLLQYGLGKDKAGDLLSLHNNIVREQLKTCDGREVEWEGNNFVASFASVAQAVKCAVSIQKALHVAAELIDLRIGLHAGEPVHQSNALFGSTVKFAQYLCRISKGKQITISSVVLDLFKKDSQMTPHDQIRWLSHSEENFLELLMDTLVSCWRDPQFGINEFCRNMSMSKPQLYRKSKSLTGMSPNELLREFRLVQSLNLLTKENLNVTQTTFEAGFSSPSYFTKCFQKKFGLPPLTYLKVQV